MSSEVTIPDRCQGLANDPCISGRRRILFLSSTREQADRFIAAAARSDRCQARPGCVNPQLACDETEVCWVMAHTLEQALATLQELYISLVLIDLRWREGVDQEHDIADARRLLEALDHVDEIEQRYGFHRILVLVSGPNHDRIDQLILELGARGVGHVIRDTSTGRAGKGACVDADAAFAGRVVTEAIELINDRQPGKRALCAAGGGITGIYYELGALKCFEDCLRPRSVNRFDMYFGISAGAVVTGLLAVGYSVEEIMAAIAGVEGGRIPELNLGLLRLSHLNHSGYMRRLGRASWSVPSRVRKLLRGRSRQDLSYLVFEYGEILGAPFHTEGFEKVLQGLFSRRGATNDFTRLSRPLFVGATDQDAKRHVLFGTGNNRDIPISRAIQASLSINPAFSSVKITGRYYEDGAVTRTTNFHEAITRGARLIILLDPFVPYVSPKPGFSHRRGILYNVDQDIRAISYTRFDNTRSYILRKHPEVSAYTFLPANRFRRLMSINPMDHRPFLEIWRGAYLSTYKRIRHLRHRLNGDLVAHGISLDTSLAQEVAERLASVVDPTFEDFFVDRDVVIPRPPLCLDRHISR